MSRAKNNKRKELCPYCGDFIKYPGHYQHVPKCEEEHNSIKLYKTNKTEIIENLKENDQFDIPIINVIKAIVSKSESKIYRKIMKLKSRIRILEENDLYEDKFIPIENDTAKIHGVYFIKCNNFVKIGYSSRFKRRFRTLNNSTPYTLEPLLFLKGSMQLEAYLHRRFHKYRVKGEWFTLSPKIRAFINNIKNNDNNINYKRLDSWN